jgi:hypothetical protein
MSLTTLKVQLLKAKSFDKLFAASEAKYRAMADQAIISIYNRASGREKVLLGDVVGALQGGVETDPAFQRHLKQRRLTFASWPVDFAEYIMEQVSPQPELKPRSPKRAG